MTFVLHVLYKFYHNVSRKIKCFSSAMVQFRKISSWNLSFRVNKSACIVIVIVCVEPAKCLIWCPLRSSPSVPVAVSEIQNHKQKNLRGGHSCHWVSYLQGCLEVPENQKTGIESGRNGARKRLL